MLWGKTRKCSLLQTELKGLMHHTAYFILKRCGSWPDPCHFIQLSAAVLKHSWRCRRGGGRGREPVSLLPRKPRLAYLTPVPGDVTDRDRPLKTGDSLKRTGHCCRNEGVLLIHTQGDLVFCCVASWWKKLCRLLGLIIKIKRSGRV